MFHDIQPGLATTGQADRIPADGEGVPWVNNLGFQQFECHCFSIKNTQAGSAWVFGVMIPLRNVKSLVDMQHIRGRQVVGCDDLSWIDITKIAGYSINGFIG